MNTDTGKIIPAADLDAELGEPKKPIVKDTPRWEKWVARKLMKRRIKMMAIPPTPEQCVRGYVALNDYCPCGSQKKFKKCCYTGDK